GTEWVEEKDVSALIVLPESDSAPSTRLIVNKEDERGVTTQAVAGILDKLLQQANLAAVGATPAFGMTTETVSTGADDLSYADFLLTGMIGLSVAQGGLFGMVELVDMRRRGLMTRLRMTPANMSLFGMAGMLVKLMLGIIQIVILSLIGVLGF